MNEKIVTWYRAATRWAAMVLMVLTAIDALAMLFGYHQSTYTVFRNTMLAAYAWWKISRDV